jgi:hypothetical protein
MSINPSSSRASFILHGFLGSLAGLNTSPGWVCLEKLHWGSLGPGLQSWALEGPAAASIYLPPPLHPQTSVCCGQTICQSHRDTKGHITYDSIYIKYAEQVSAQRTRLVVAGPQGEGWGMSVEWVQD